MPSALERGDVWLVDLGYAAKTRPCLVVSIAAHEEDRALATVVPHTTSVRGTRFEVRLSVPFLQPGAFDAQNVITIPHAKLLRRLGALSADQVRSLEDSLRRWLGL